MKNYEGIYRRIGSAGLVIFERDGTLLRRNSPPRDFMLGDISNEFVQILQQLRKIDVCFGFVSDARGMDVGSHGRSAFATLTGRLDEVLRIREAMPDFWMAWDIFPQGSGKEVHAGEKWRRRDDAGLAPAMILQAVEWYGVEKKEAIFVNSSAVGLLAANEAGISAIQYTGFPPDRTIAPSRELERQFFKQSESADTQRLHAEIQRILGQGRRRSA